MIRLLISFTFLLFVLFLFYRKKLDFNLTSLLIFFLALFLIISNSDLAIYLLADILGIEYVPLSIVSVAIGLIFCLCICFAVLIEDTRRRQIEILKLICEEKITKKMRK